MTPFLLGQSRPAEPALVWPWAHNWQSPLSERLEWRTAIKKLQSGKEQRQAQRREPRLYFSQTSLLVGDEVVHLQQALSAWAGREWAVPAWWASSRLAAAASTTLALNRPTATLWPASGWALLWRSPADCEPVTVASVGTTSLTLGAAAAGSWPAGSLVVPLYFATLEDSQRVTGHTAEVAAVTCQWAVDPSLNTVLAEANTWDAVWPDGAVNTPRAHLWRPQGNWSSGTEVTVDLPVDVFDPGVGGLARRAAVDLPTLQWGQRVLVTDAAKLRQFAAAHRGAALGFHAANPLADIRVDSVAGSEVTWAQELPHDNPGALFDGVLLRGDLTEMSLAGASLVDATGNHNVSGSGISVAGGWITLGPAATGAISPALTSASGEPWTVQFRASLGGRVNVGQQDTTCTYINIAPTEYDPRMLFALSSRSGGERTCVSAPVNAGALVAVRYRQGVVEVSADGQVLASAAVGGLTLAFNQFGHWQNQAQFNGNVQALTVSFDQVTVARAAAVRADGATLAVPISLANVTYARLVSPARLASDALEITHHTGGVAEATLAIRTTTDGLVAAGGGVDGGSGGGGGTTPGLLMHFDSSLTDSYRGRLFTGTATYSTDAAAGSHSVSALSASSTQELGDFDFGTGNFTVEFRIKRLFAHLSVAGDLVRYLGAGGELLWKVSHAYGEAIMTPSFWAYSAAPQFISSVIHGYPTGVWQHILIKRTGGTLTFSVDGTVVHTVSYPVTITAADAGVAAGSIQVLMETTNALIDELKVTPS